MRIRREDSGQRPLQSTCKIWLDGQIVSSLKKYRLHSTIRHFRPSHWYCLLFGVLFGSEYEVIWFAVSGNTLELLSVRTLDFFAIGHEHHACSSLS